MIGAYYGGRLGNLFFIYAAARALRFARGEKDSFLFNFGEAKDSLQYFNTLPYGITKDNLCLKIGSAKQIISYLWFRRFHRKLTTSDLHKLDRAGIIYTREDYEDLSIEIPETRNVVMRGRMEIPDYFKDIRNILLQEFTPKYPVLKQNEEFLQKIKSSNSVCVHVRRGDYMSPEFKKDFFVCDEDYFNHAINLIMEKVDNPTFVFFSNDINWVKNNIRVNAPCLYESGNDPVWETMRLMYSCKHFVISNSTLSWWAQYLSRNENKIIISPNRWFANPDWKAHFIQKEFITLNTDI